MRTRQAEEADKRDRPERYRQRTHADEANRAGMGLSQRSNRLWRQTQKTGIEGRQRRQPVQADIEERL